MTKSTRFGVIQDFLIDNTSPTGYAISFLIDGKLVQYPATKELYDSQYLPEYTFPLITETPHLCIFNDDQVACAVEMFEPGVNMNGTYAFGEPKTSGYIATIQDGNLVLNAEHIRQELDNGCMRYYNAYYHGNKKPVGNTDKVLEFSDDAVIYCMDFVGGARKHVVVDLNFLADVLNNRKNCYWLSIYDLYGTDEKIDCICFFLHSHKDPNGKGGDMSKTTMTVEERRAEALTTEDQV
jgi:hypothetical protein